MSTTIEPLSLEFQVSRPDDLKEELEKCLDENVLLQEQLGRKNTELHHIHSE